MSRSAFEVLLGRAPAASAAPAAGTVRGSAGPGAAGKRRGEAGGRQTVLALGQRNLKSECRLCGMLYMPGDPIDSRSHARFHQTYTKGIVCRVSHPRAPARAWAGGRWSRGCGACDRYTRRLGVRRAVTCLASAASAQISDEHRQKPAFARRQ